VTLSPFMVFKDPLGLVNEINGHVNKIWVSGESFDSRIVFIGPS